MSAPTDVRPVAWRIAAHSLECRFEDALEEGKQALVKFGERAEILVAVGRVYLDASRPREALEHIERAVAAAPKNHVAAGWRAVCYARLCKLEKAIETARAALDEPTWATRMPSPRPTTGWAGSCSSEARALPRHRCGRYPAEK
jgi:tetratricopeptide (TPR) repeat protein